MADLSTVELERSREITVLDEEGLEVADISALAFDPEDPNRVAIIDKSRHRAVLVDLTRRQVIAATGSEVQRPTHVTFRQGQLLVTDVNPVVHVTDPLTLEVRRTIPLEQTLFARRVHPTPAGFITEGTDTHYPEASLFEYSMDGELLRSWNGFSTGDVAPFWGAFFWEHAAVHGADVYVGSAMRYPLVRYGADGGRLEFGEPPSNYRAPRRPEPFEFAGAGEARVRYEEFVRSFTMVSSVWTTERHLLVELRDFDPAESAFRSPTYTFDVYDRTTLQRLGTRLASPGPVIGGKGDELFVLTSRPPTGGWVVSAFRIVAGGGA